LLLCSGWPSWSDNATVGGFEWPQQLHTRASAGQSEVAPPAARLCGLSGGDNGDRNCCCRHHMLRPLSGGWLLLLLLLVARFAGT